MMFEKTPEYKILRDECTEISKNIQKSIITFINKMQMYDETFTYFKKFHHEELKKIEENLIAKVDERILFYLSELKIQMKHKFEE